MVHMTHVTYVIHVTHMTPVGPGLDMKRCFVEVAGAAGFPNLHGRSRVSAPATANDTTPLSATDFNRPTGNG